MFSKKSRNAIQKKKLESITSVIDGLKTIYRQNVLPLEEQHFFHELHSPRLSDPDFEAKPMILLVGQYSTGKTSFIRYLVERDFPGLRIGPEPTTDKFIALMHGEQEGVIPGNALVVDPTKQFAPLSKFGGAFLQRLQVSQVDSPLLRSLSIIDTPGILSGEKQRTDRGYDFTAVLQWFAERADRIILLFDAHKLDISDEFRRVIEALKSHDDKIRIVLNKSDMVTQQQLMRVYGALMWALGKVFATPEVVRVFIGSFWDQPLRYEESRKLFEFEQHDLLYDIQGLPRNAAIRKMNDLIKRARLAKVNAYICHVIKEKYDQTMFNKDSKKKEIIKQLHIVFENIQKEKLLSPGDFPNINEMREKLKRLDWSKLKSYNKKLIEELDRVLAQDIPRFMTMIPQELEENATQNILRGSLFENSIFDHLRGEGADAGSLQSEWIVNKDKHLYMPHFNRIKATDEKVEGAAAKEEMLKSDLPQNVLAKVWRLSDIDKDGKLDEDEFCLAMHLIRVKLDNYDLPMTLPEHLIPPSKKGFGSFS